MRRWRARVLPGLWLLAACAGSGAGPAGGDLPGDDAVADGALAETGGLEGTTDVSEEAPDLPPGDPGEEGDPASEVPCVEGETFCDGDLLVLCGTGGSQVPVTDCAEDGWACSAGRCEPLGPEQDSEKSWRERLVGLRIENARTPLETDGRGGWVNAPGDLDPGPGTGFFRVARAGGAWWFVTPEGRLMLSKGVTDVNFLGPNLALDDLQAALAAKYGSEEAWAVESERRLREWGFNTAGPWSGESALSRVVDAGPILDIVHHVPRPGEGLAMDVFVPEYPEIVRQLARDRCAPRKDDPNLLGWFLDNELVWDNGWQTPKRLLRIYFEFPEGQPGRDEALVFLREMAGDSLEAFNAAWKASLESWLDLPRLSPDTLDPETPQAVAWSEAFAVRVFERYAGEAVRAVREADPNHLVLGCRFSTWHFDGLMAAAARHFDVVSLAYYWETPPVDHLDRAGPTIDRPFLLEEWSFKGADSGLMNVLNFAPVVPTQKDRGLAYHRYVEDLVRRPWVVAYHWYKWFDNPPREDNVLAGDNFGLLDPHDEPYLPLVRLAAETNRRVERWHLDGVR